MSMFGGIDINSKYGETEFFRRQGIDLVMCQKKPTDSDWVFIGHYSNPGYRTFGELLFARWYYGLEPKDIPFGEVNSEDHNWQAAGNIYVMAGLESQWRLLKERPEDMYTEEGFLKQNEYAIDTTGKSVLSVQLILMNNDVHFKKIFNNEPRGEIVIEKELIQETLETILSLTSPGDLSRDAFKDLYDSVMKEAEKHESPYKAPGKN